VVIGTLRYLWSYRLLWVDLGELVWVIILASATAGVEDVHNTVNKPLKEKGELITITIFSIVKMKYSIAQSIENVVCPSLLLILVLGLLSSQFPGF
jgi:hypothetical protein